MAGKKIYDKIIINILTIPNRRVINMYSVLIISIIIVIIVLILSVMTTSKAYQFKHTVDSVEENPKTRNNSKNSSEIEVKHLDEKK